MVGVQILPFVSWVFCFPNAADLAESLNDFIAGYVSGIAGLVIGSPLDILKVRLQASSQTSVRPAENFPKVRRPICRSLIPGHLPLHGPSPAPTWLGISECHSFHFV